MVDEYDAVGMVDFVLEHACEESISFEAEFVAIDVHSFDANTAVAGDFAIIPADTKAAFIIGDELAFVFDDFGVDERNEFFVVFVLELRAHDNHAVESVDLDSCQCGADFVGS